MGMAQKTKLKFNIQQIKFILIFILFFFFVLTSSSFASSSYVLPYPSAMPGNIFYKINLLKEKVMKYWYYGDFGQFFYNLKQSDKYLVEAKTLFEYKQHLLGLVALKKSNEYFVQIKPNLLSAKENNKDISENTDILSEAALKHTEVLDELKLELPEVFVWTPEKDNPTTINFKEILDEAINIRNESQ
ncbi:MAG: hypothetical protein AAB532_00645 [Patescibacteria group bacterium]